MPSNFKALAGAAGGGDLADPNFNNVTLLLHGDGSNGAQNNTFIDSSTNNLTITRNGNTTQGSFSPYGSNWSNYFDGSGDWLEVPSDTAFAYGTGDLTLECWIYKTSTSDTGILENRSGSGMIWYIDNSAPYAGMMRIYDGSGFYNSNTVVPLNQWVHLVACRQNGTLRYFVNGVAAGSMSWTTNLTSPTTLKIMRSNEAAQYGGYVSNLRIVKGTAVYTAAFTPPTTPLTAISGTSLLTCQSNRFRDASTNNFTITRNGDVKVTNFAPFAPSPAYSTSANGGSAYFDGNGDWLQAPNVTALQLGSSNFTIEGWVYLTSLASAPFFDQRQSGPSGQSFVIYVNSSGALSFYSYDPGWDYTSNLILRTNSWNHIAVVRNGNNATLYLNGVASSSTVNVTSYNNTSSANRIFNAFDPGYATGYLSDFRIVKGVAVYTTNFTPPTTPLTAIANTSLLLNATNAAIFDNSMKNDLETVGNAQISTSVKKFGTGSMYFDGTGDSCRIAVDDPNLQFGTGNFTAEGWIYPTGAAVTNQHIITGGTSWTTNSGGIYLYYSGGSTTLGAAWNQLPANPAVVSGSIAANTWHHFALVRNSNTLTLYINGTSVSTYNVSGYNLALNNQSRTNIGGGGWDSDLSAYLDDIRITKGIARYTANFTAPSAPFPNK